MEGKKNEHTKKQTYNGKKEQQCTENIILKKKRGITKTWKKCR